MSGWTVPARITGLLPHPAVPGSRILLSVASRTGWGAIFGFLGYNQPLRLAQISTMTDMMIMIRSETASGPYSV